MTIEDGIRGRDLTDAAHLIATTTVSLSCCKGIGTKIRRMCAGANCCIMIQLDLCILRLSLILRDPVH